MTVNRRAACIILCGVVVISSSFQAWSVFTAIFGFCILVIGLIQLVLKMPKGMTKSPPQPPSIS